MKERWIDSLPTRDTEGWTTHGYRHSALQWLTEALYWTEVGEQPKIVANALAHAGATIVAWRKSLDDQGERLEIDPAVPATHEYYIGECIRTLTWDVEAENLRFVEAILRYIWKQGQR